MSCVKTYVVFELKAITQTKSCITSNVRKQMCFSYDFYTPAGQELIQSFKHLKEQRNGTSQQKTETVDKFRQRKSVQKILFVLAVGMFKKRLRSGSS